jgi:hypothetical protein
VHLTSVHAATYKGCTDAISSIRSNDHAKYANRMYSRGPGDVRAPIRSLESSCTSGILRAVLHSTVRAATYQDRIEATSNTGSNDHGTYASHKYSPRLGAFYVPTRCTDGSCTSGFLGVVLRNAADREASNSPGINAMSMARKILATKSSGKPRCRVSSYPDIAQQVYERALLNAVVYKVCVCSDVHRLDEGRNRHQPQRQTGHDDSRL